MEIYEDGDVQSNPIILLFLSDLSLLVCAGPDVSYLIHSLKLSDMRKHIAVNQS